MGIGDGNKHRLAACSGVLLMLLLLLACETTMLTPTSHGNPPVVTSSVLQPTIEQAQVDAYVDIVRAEREQREAQMTLDALYGVQTATAVAGQATATARAELATATAIAGWGTATAVSWITTVEAAYAQATATAQAHRVAATSTALAAQATATVEAVYFQQAATATAAAWAIQTTSTVEAARSIATIQAAEAARAELATRREEVIYPVKAYGPWVILAVVLIWALWAGYRLMRAWELRLRAVPRDARGDAPVLLLDQRGGNFVILDPDRAFGPATVVGETVTQPALAAPELQERTTARDQAIDLASRGVPQARSQAAGQPSVRQAAQLMGPPRALVGPVRVIPPARIRGWLRDVEPQALRDALTVEGEVLDD